MVVVIFIVDGSRNGSSECGTEVVDTVVIAMMDKVQAVVMVTVVCLLRTRNHRFYNRIK